MKKPNLKNLKVNQSQTKSIRSAMGKKDSVKITINIDADTLATLRLMADESGIPYQRLLNRTLSEGLAGKKTIESRLSRVEKELKALKKTSAA